VISLRTAGTKLPQNESGRLAGEKSEASTKERTAQSRSWREVVNSKARRLEEIRAAAMRRTT
jgi:hypothetical protein